MKAAAIFVIISTILIVSWFRFGFIYGGGDVGLPFYNPDKMVEISKYVWWGAIAPGFLVPHGLTSLPLQFILSVLQHLGVSPLFIQATTFFALIFLMGFGMYLFVSTILGTKKIYAILAGVFYVFNPYMMIQVWHRFVHNSIFLVAALPFFAIFWLLWIRKGDIKYLILFLITNLLFGYLYGAIAFVVSVWLFILLISLPDVLFPWAGKKVFLKVAKYFSVGLILWLLTNSWWILPTFGIGPALFAEQHNTDENLINLLELSKQTIIPYSLQQINPFYLYFEGELGGIYQTFPFLLFPWLLVAVTTLGFVSALKDKKLAGLGVIYLITFFLSKGAASPFNNLFVFGFQHFFPLGVIRNPFEKIGILLPFISTILLMIGLKVSFDWLKRKLNTSMAIFILTGYCVSNFIFLWPMFAGKIFGKVNNPAFVEVPKSYSEANLWFNEQDRSLSPEQEGRILHLPLSRREDTSLNWTYGYNGIESSAVFFTSSDSISRGFNIPRIDDTLTGLSLLFTSPFSNNRNQILEALQEFNVRYIVLHKDMNWLGRDLYNPEETEKLLDNLDFLQKKAQFGNLTIYQLKDDEFEAKITLSGSFNIAYPPESSMMMWPYFVKDAKTVTITAPQFSAINKLADKNSSLMIFPNKTIDYKEASASGIKNLVDELTVAPYSFTGSPLYGVWIRSQIFTQTGEIQKAGLDRSTVAAGEILSRIFGSQSINPLQINGLIDNYARLIDQVFEKRFDQSSLRFDLTEGQFSEVFQKHLIILNKLAEVYGQDKQIKEKIQNLINQISVSLREQKLLPQYNIQSLGEAAGKTRVYLLDVPKSGRYELLMTNPKTRKIYKDNLNDVDWQIDDKVLRLASKDSSGFLSFGDIDFNQGIHQLSPNLQLSANLLSPLKAITFANNIKLVDDKTVQLIAGGNTSFFENEINSVTGGDVYQFTFTAKIEQGNRFFVQLVQDTDPEEKDNKIKIANFNFSVMKTPLNSDWQEYTVTFPSLNLTAQKASIRIILEPSGSSTAVNSALIKDMRIERILTNGILLKSSQQNTGLDQKVIFDKVSFSRISPVSYQGSLHIENPTFFLFKESYHPGWKLRLFKDGKEIATGEHLIGDLYANAWYIEQAGDYNFKLDFQPQENVTRGLYLALLGWAIPIMVFLTQRFRLLKKQ